MVGSPLPRGEGGAEYSNFHCSQIIADFIAIAGNAAGDANETSKRRRVTDVRKGWHQGGVITFSEQTPGGVLVLPIVRSKNITNIVMNETEEFSVGL